MGEHCRRTAANNRLHLDGVQRHFETEHFLLVLGPTTLEVFLHSFLIGYRHLLLWRALLVRVEVFLFVFVVVHFLFVFGAVKLHVKVHDVLVGDLIMRLRDYTPEKHVLKVGVLLLSLVGSSTCR